MKPSLYALSCAVGRGTLGTEWGHQEAAAERERQIEPPAADFLSKAKRRLNHQHPLLHPRLFRERLDADGSQGSQGIQSEGLLSRSETRFRLNLNLISPNKKRYTACANSMSGLAVQFGPYEA